MESVLCGQLLLMQDMCSQDTSREHCILGSGWCVVHRNPFDYVIAVLYSDSRRIPQRDVHRFGFFFHLLIAIFFK